MIVMKHTYWCLNSFLCKGFVYFFMHLKACKAFKLEIACYVKQLATHRT